MYNDTFKPGYSLKIIDGEEIYVKGEIENTIERLEEENLLLKAQMQFQTERADLLEGALIEIASMVVE